MFINIDSTLSIFQILIEIMKIPTTPKPLHELFDQESKDLSKIFSMSVSPTPAGKYLHWDNLRHRKPPEGLTSEQWWLAVKFARHGTQREIPLKDKHGSPFNFNTPPLITQYLHDIDSKGSGRIAMPTEVFRFGNENAVFGALPGRGSNYIEPIGGRLNHTKKGDGNVPCGETTCRPERTDDFQ